MGKRAPNRCAWCLEIGHDLRNCELARSEGRKRHSKHVAQNAGYRANRAAGLCDNCGARSKRFALCTRCRLKRALAPSRQAGYPRGDRTAEYARRNAQRRKRAAASSQARKRSLVTRGRA